MSSPSAALEQDEPRWLVDEMLGRLSRYLRFLGYDTEYVRGASDDEIVVRARRETRRLITRDRALSSQLTDSVLLTTTDIEGQVRQLREALPSLRLEVRFDRCSICNGRLSPGGPLTYEPSRTTTVPPEVRAGSAPYFVCDSCGQLYWEGSHTREVRKRLSEWFREEPSFS